MEILNDTPINTFEDAKLIQDPMELTFILIYMNGSYYKRNIKKNIIDQFDWIFAKINDNLFTELNKVLKVVREN